MNFLIPNYLMTNFKLLIQLVLELLTRYTWNFQNQYLILPLIGAFYTMMRAFLILLKMLLKIGQDFYLDLMSLILDWLVYGSQVNFVANLAASQIRIPIRILWRIQKESAVIWFWQGQLFIIINRQEVIRIHNSSFSKKEDFGILQEFL